MIGIYRIVNKETGKCYVGKSTTISSRIWKHFYYLDQGFHVNRSGNPDKLQNSYNKYGKDNFYWEVIEECSKEDLNEKEIYWIKFYNSYSDGYNQTPGGDGGDTFSYKTDEEKSITRKRRSEGTKRSKLMTNGEFETRVKISEIDAYISQGWWIGFSDSHKENLKKNHVGFSGKKKSEEHNKKMRDRFKGILLTEDHRKKLSESHKGYVMPDSQKNKISEKSKDRIKINNGFELKLVKENELNHYIENGWEIGWGERICINNGIEQKKIYKVYLDYYIGKGYVEGEL